MLNRDRQDEKSQTTFLSKFARIFGLLMTLIYVALGLFIMFASESLRLSVGKEVRYMLGGILILYGVVRFIRVYKSSSRSNRHKYED